MTLNKKIFLGLLLASINPVQVFATNGYSPTGFGTINKGLAGAGVALPQDAMSIATNPAGTAGMGHRAEMGVALFSPSKRGYTANNDAQSPMQITPGNYDSKNDLFLIPHMAWNKPLDENRSLSIAIGANGGMNTEYGHAVFGNFGQAFGIPASSPTGVDFAQVFMGISYAAKLNEKHAIGIMPIIAMQRFKATGLEPFGNPMASVNPTKVSNNGYDTSWGYGARIGWLGKITKDLTLAASYQSRLNMDEFDDYSGLFAEQGDFDTPSTWVVGLAYKATESLTLLLDYQRIYYGEVKSLANSNNLDIFSNPENRLGADEGLGFGWDDMNIVKIAAQWQYDDNWTLRAGYSHASKLFEGGQALFNILAPATIRDHLSLGGGYKYNEQNTINFALTRSLKEKISGNNKVFTPGQTGSVAMSQWELELSWTYLY